MENQVELYRSKAYLEYLGFDQLSYPDILSMLKFMK